MTVQALNKGIKAVAFSRDGTLNHNPSTSQKYILRPEDLHLLPGVAEAVWAVRRAGLLPFVFSQQSCVGEGLITHKELRIIHGQMQQMLGEDARIEKFYYCPHTQAEECSCRKPLPGMLLQMMKDYNLEPDEILVIGDSARDFSAAKSIGARFVLTAPEQWEVVSALGSDSLEVPAYADVHVAVLAELQNISLSLPWATAKHHPTSAVAI